MTAWMLLAVAQPLLVGTRRKRLHVKLGVLGVVLAAGIIVAGLKIGIEAARVNPPEMRVFGLTSKGFMAVPGGPVDLRMPRNRTIDYGRV